MTPPGPPPWAGGRRGAPSSEETFDVTVLLKPGSPPPGLAKLGPPPWAHAKRLGHKPNREFHPPNPKAMVALGVFARKNKLKVRPSRHDAMHAHLVGTAAQLKAALGVDLAEFNHRGQTVVAHQHDDDIPIPKELANYVQHILPDRRPTGHHKLGGVIDPRRLGRVLTDEGTPEGAISPTFSPAEMRELYGFPKGHNGKGQSIGILALGGSFFEEDLDAYFEALAMDKPNIVVVGENNPPDKAIVHNVMEWMNVRGAELDEHDQDALEAAIQTVEATMDIQAAAAFAPEATIVVYTTPGSSVQDLLDVLNAVLDDKDHKCSVVSCSHAIAEGSLPAYTDFGIDYLLQKFADEGITACFASGDFGAQGVSQFVEATAPQVMWPAASEWAVACGGTRVVVPPGGGPRPPIHALKQIVFREKLGAPIGLMTSGGGFSEKTKIPSWQAETLTEWGQRSQETAGGRGIPDLALNAHMESSFLIRVGGYNATAGGTSASAPVFAALVACINEVLDTRLGHVTPLLYDARVREALAPVVLGDNDISDDVEGFHARRGWDPCTGIGTPTDALLDALRTVIQDTKETAPQS